MIENHIFCLVLCSLPTYVFASGESIANIPKYKEVYTDYDLGGTIEKSIAVLIASSYNYVTIEGRIRYGDDGTYYYYERYTNIYGNGVDPLFNKDYYDTGKELL